MLCEYFRLVYGMDESAISSVFVCFSSKSVYYSLSEEPVEDVLGAQTRDLHPYSDGECSPNDR